MSTVRMCDNPQCCEIFSELEEGWSTSQQAQVITTPEGVRKTVSVSVDMCPDCSGNTAETAAKLAEARRERRRERLALEAPKERNVRTDGRGRHTGDPEDRWEY